MNDTPCADCGVEILPTDHRRAEWYVVVDEVPDADLRGHVRRRLDAYQHRPGDAAMNIDPIVLGLAAMQHRRNTANHQKGDE